MYSLHTSAIRSNSVSFPLFSDTSAVPRTRNVSVRAKSPVISCTLSSAAADIFPSETRNTTYRKISCSISRPTCPPLTVPTNPTRGNICGSNSTVTTANTFATKRTYPTSRPSAGRHIPKNFTTCLQTFSNTTRSASCTKIPCGARRHF